MQLQCANCAYRSAASNFVASPRGPKCLLCRGPAQMVGGNMTPTPYEQASLVTTPRDVDNEKRDINPYAAATNAAVIGAAPGSLSDSFIAGWGAWYRNWKAFYAANSSLFSASGDMQIAKQKRAELTQFQAQLDAAGVGVSQVPAQSAPAATGGSTGSDPTGIGGAITNASNNVNTVVKIALVAGVGLVAWLIYEQATVAKALGPGLISQLPAMTSAGVTAAKF